MFDKIKAIRLYLLVSAATLLNPDAVKCLNNFTAADLALLQADINGPRLVANLNNNRTAYTNHIFAWLHQNHLAADTGIKGNINNTYVALLRTGAAAGVAYKTVRDQLLAISICNKCAWDKVNIIPLFIGDDNTSHNAILAIGNLTPAEQDFVVRFRDRYFTHIAKHFASRGLLINSSRQAVPRTQLIPLNEMNVTLSPAAPAGAQPHSFCTYSNVNANTFIQAKKIAKSVSQNFINTELHNMNLIIDATGVTILRNGAANYAFQYPSNRLNYPNNPNGPIPVQIFVAQYNAAITKTEMIQNAAVLALAGGNVSIFFRLWIPMNQAINGPNQLGSFFPQ